jgi:hypothetical protein
VRRQQLEQDHLWTNYESENNEASMPTQITLTSIYRMISSRQ